MTRITCPDCGWTSNPCRSSAQADYALSRHSCARERRRRESRARGEARTAAVDRDPRPCPHPRADHRHGTYVCYTRDRCRCEPCVTARAAYERSRVRRQAYGRWDGLVDAEPARDHVEALMAAGMGLKRVAALSGVAHGVLSKLVYGERGTGPSRRIRPDNERRLLATRVDLAGGAQVDHTGTTRRIQALVAIGWSQSRIAREAGVRPGNLTPIAHGRRAVTAATRQTVRDLYDRWSMTPPPADTRRDRIAAARARRHAATHGWAPPLAWDDDTIDDPDAAPHAETESTGGVDPVAVARRAAGDTTVTLDRVERLTLVAMLTAQGLGSAEIARRTGYHPRQIVRDRADTRQAAA